jgi:hypothetical protein
MQLLIALSLMVFCALLTVEGIIMVIDKVAERQNKK